jgi:phosphate transport system protein
VTPAGVCGTGAFLHSFADAGGRSQPSSQLGFYFPFNLDDLFAIIAELVPADLNNELVTLKEKLLTMASHAEAAVNRAIKALLRRDDDLARRTKEEDSVIDRLEMDIDEDAIQLLARKPGPFELRLITMAMKIALDLERVGDEATTISRRCLELSHEAPLKQPVEIPRMATLALQMLKDSLDAFVYREPARARAVIPRDEGVDAMNKKLHRELARYMAEQPATITRCLNLMVISKSLERIADHATNIAELVVYLYEGQDIRHTGKAQQGKSDATSPRFNGSTR